MRKLDLKIKLQAASCPELVDGLVAEAKHLKRNRGMKWQYALGNVALLNFVVAWYLNQSPAEKERIARAGKELLVDILSEPESEPTDGSGSIIKSKANSSSGSAKKLPHRNTYKTVGHDSALLEV